MHTIIRPLAIAALALALGACGSGEQQKAAGPGGPGGPGAMPPPTVGVIVAKAESVPISVELPGRTTPYTIAEVRPQVTGILSQRLFVEGSDVKAGAELYEIEPATYQATLQSAKATLARAEANLGAAKVKAQRYAELVLIDAVSKQANDDAQVAVAQAAAEVTAARAAVDKAAIDLAYTRVKAPIAGRIGRSAVTPGALVTANQPAALATIQQLDPIYVDVSQSSTEILRLKREFDAGRLKRSGAKTLPVKLVLEDGSEYSLPGKLAVSEAMVDPGTGDVTLRAIFPNPQHDLLPGMYVRARLVEGSREGAILVPHAAVTRDPRGNAMVMVVNADNKVEPRPVEATQTLGSSWVIGSGIAPGDRVIVEGLQRARPGTPVQAVPAGSAPAQPGQAPGQGGTAPGQPAAGGVPKAAEAGAVQAPPAGGQDAAATKPAPAEGKDSAGAKAAAPGK